MADTANEDELTVDELAARVGMTVRNVRAYASRGLLAPPRLEGRTGYYTRSHVKQLQLVRSLLDRGYTLQAVEKALQDKTSTTADYALDLITVLDSPLAREPESELMSRDRLSAMAGIDRDTDLAQKLVDRGLATIVDDDTLEVNRPEVVRAGAAAISLGLAPETVLELLPALSGPLRTVADDLVGRVRRDIWQPFVGAGMPDDQWQEVVTSIANLLPVAAQAVVAVFRDELAHAIDDALGEELAALGDQRPAPEA
ncbi:MerR family transcriptional regulator [Mumia sp. zg.B53]|uniref:MerR family transcriptional regulator n=1 Tax=unclassified Mumia TaxID=2621872 RepID=UPI001C6EA85D|nr:MULTISPECIES: MerR family transcriptional regulator [unclassified Mumia]MBW9208049.1 MerR family transcriptional regulator [Mumia sp. zg.B21]MBW9216003.1 MerR family transcriptional regulator [Mumia sp. zg.B53]MDD9347710.1 MerR family transcriptional regulator [Mumia sp.]